MMDSRYDRAARQRIRWHSRRGLLEMDLVLTRFLDRHFDTLGDEEMDAYVRLLELIDTEFLEIVGPVDDTSNPCHDSRAGRCTRNERVTRIARTEHPGCINEGNTCKFSPLRGPLADERA